MYLAKHITIEVYIKNIEEEFDFFALDRWKLKKQTKAAARNELLNDDSEDSEDSEDLLEVPQEVPIPASNWLDEDRPTTSYYDDMNPEKTPYSIEELIFFSLPLINIQ